MYTVNVTIEKQLRNNYISNGTAIFEEAEMLVKVNLWIVKKMYNMYIYTHDKSLCNSM